MIADYDLTVTNDSGTSYGYVLSQDTSLGQPCIHASSEPQISVPNVGAEDYRDVSGDRGVSFTDWSLGAGQESYDASDAEPGMFWASSSIDTATKGQITLERAFTCTSGKPTTAAGFLFAACGVVFWCGTGSAGFKVSSDGSTWTDVTSGTGVGVISGWCTDGTSIWVCSKADTTDAIYKVTGSGTTWTAAAYGSASTDEKVHALAYNAGMVFAAVEDSNGKMRIAMVDATTGTAASYSTTSNLTSPVMLGASATVALTSAGNSVYWVTQLGNRCTVYEITYDPSVGSGVGAAMYTQQFMECPNGFICTCARGYLSSLYLGGYYWSATSGVGKGAIYFAQGTSAAPLLELGEVPEETPIASDPTNNNIIRFIADAGKDLYFATDRGVYRWDIDDGGYVQTHDLTKVTGYAGPTWSANDFDASTDSATFFPASWTETTDDLTKTLTDGALVFSGTGTSEGYISSAFSSTTGGTVLLSIGAGHAGITKVYVEDGAKAWEVWIGPDYVQVGDEPGTFSSNALPPSNIITTSTAARTVRLVTYGSYLYVYVNDNEATCLRRVYDSTTATNKLRLVFASGNKLVSWDYDDAAWFPGSGSAVPSVLGLAYNKNVVYVSYSAGGTYYLITPATTYSATGWLQSSETSLKTGTLKKNILYVDVSHSPLGTATIGATLILDGLPYVLSGTATSNTSTRFTVGQSGYSLAYRIDLTAGTSQLTTPTVKSVNISYSYGKARTNTYLLHCAAGAQSGRWLDNPQAAISHLFTCADQRCTFEDVFNGTYYGSIKDVKFLKAARSIREGYSGIVSLEVREEA